MDIKQLEAFSYTVKYQSFSEAAKRLYLSQPTISTHIHALENELHIKLIQRTTRDFSITPAGLRLYEYACSILQLREKALEELLDDRKKILHIGASSVPALYTLPKILSEYHRIYPDITIQAYSSDSLDIIHKVSNGHLDAGLVGTTIPDSSCTFLPFATDELVIATPNTPHYQKFRKNKASLQTLLMEPMIMREDNSGTKKEWEHFLTQMNITPEQLHAVAYINHPEAVKHCIIHGLGISIISRKIVEYSASQKQLLIFPLGEHQLLRRFYLVYVKERYLPKVTSDFIHLFGNYSFERL